MGGSASGFDGVAQIGPAPMYEAPERAPAMRLADVPRGQPELQPGAERALRAVVVTAEVDAVGLEPDRRVDVVVDDEHRVELAKRTPEPRRAPSSTRP